MGLAARGDIRILHVKLYTRVGLAARGEMRFLGWWGHCAPIKPYGELRILFLKFWKNLISSSGFRFQINKIDLTDI